MTIAERIRQIQCYFCIYAIFDKHPYGMGYAEELTGCRKEDDLTEEQMDAIEEGKIDCPYREE